MKEIGTIAAINFHVSLVEATNFHCDLVKNLNYHIISAHILLLLQVMESVALFERHITFNNLLVSSFMLSSLLYIFILVFRSTEETTSAKLPIVISVMRDKSHEGDAKPTYRKKSEKIWTPETFVVIPTKW